MSFPRVAHTHTHTHKNRTRERELKFSIEMQFGESKVAVHGSFFLVFCVNPRSNRTEQQAKQTTWNHAGGEREREWVWWGATSERRGSFSYISYFFSVSNIILSQQSVDRVVCSSCCRCAAVLFGNIHSVDFFLGSWWSSLSNVSVVFLTCSGSVQFFLRSLNSSCIIFLFIKFPFKFISFHG